MAGEVTLNAQWVLAIIVVLVAPLYGGYGVMLWRTGKQRGRGERIDENEEDIEQNDDRIREIQKSLARIERDVTTLRRDMETIHDLVADSNHCGSASCRFCEVEDEDELSFIGPRQPDEDDE